MIWFWLYEFCQACDDDEVVLILYVRFIFYLFVVETEKFGVW